MALMLVGGLKAQTGGGTVFRFLNLPADARSAALGGAPVSLPDADLTGMHANPALLRPAHHRQASIQAGRYLGTLTAASTAFAWHSADWGTFAAGIRYLGYGSLDGRTPDNTSTGTFSAYDAALKLAWSRAVGERVRFGLAVDPVISSYGRYRSTALLYSGGLFVSSADASTTFGVAFRNAGRQATTFAGRQEAVPFDLRAGASVRLKYLPLRVSLTAHDLHDWDLRTGTDTAPPKAVQQVFRHLSLGGEFFFSPDFHVRLGYDHLLHEELKSDERLDLAGFGIGVGLNIKGIRFDASRVSHSDTGAWLRIGTHLQL